MENILYILLAAFGLGFIIMLHELGHLWMAKRVGMRVEAFGIGFGKPIRVWHWQGIRWELCILPFGGYVRIAGMEKKGGVEPHQVPDGFFGKSPWQRIQVALMGPMANFLFALFLFSLLWVGGGREEPFSQHTQVVGWVESSSSYYQRGGRPGDELLTYGGRPYEGLRDLFIVGSLDSPTTEVSGYRIDYYTAEKSPYDWTLTNGPLRGSKGAPRTVGIVAPASYLIYQQSLDQRGSHYPLQEPGPAVRAGMQNGDQIVWVNGAFIFSLPQLERLLNAPELLLTIQRDGQVLQVMVPRTRVRHLTLTDHQAAELEDWRYEAGIPSKAGDLYFIPYALSHEAVVEESLVYLNEKLEESSHIPSQDLDAPFRRTLEKGDRILGVSGVSISSTPQMLREIQKPKAVVVVRRAALSPISWKEADADFMSHMSWEKIGPLVESIGALHPEKQRGEYHLLAPVEPLSVEEMSLSDTMRQGWEERYSALQEQIEGQGTESSGAQLKRLAERRSRLKLGVPVSDRLVLYNPSPWELLSDTVGETYFALKGLLTGALSAKNLSGPVGIVQVMQMGIASGVKQAIYWLGFISLSLGLVNLLPLPVLDGGHICFALWEKVTGKPISATTMKRLMIPCIILLVALLLFITWQDIARILHH